MPTSLSFCLSCNLLLLLSVRVRVGGDVTFVCIVASKYKCHVSRSGARIAENCFSIFLSLLPSQCSTNASTSCMQVTYLSSALDFHFSCHHNLTILRTQAGSFLSLHNSSMTSSFIPSGRNSTSSDGCSFTT